MRLNEHDQPNIAIIDHDESICRAISRLLRSLGMETNTFTSGHEFVSMSRASDRFLPTASCSTYRCRGLSGLEVQDFLVRSKNPLPVIFITAYDDVNVRERALRAGAVAFLRKPFHDELFLGTINKALKRDRKQES